MSPTMHDSNVPRLFSSIAIAAAIMAPAYAQAQTREDVWTMTSIGLGHSTTSRPRLVNEGLRLRVVDAFAPRSTWTATHPLWLKTGGSASPDAAPVMVGAGVIALAGIATTLIGAGLWAANVPEGPAVTAIGGVAGGLGLLVFGISFFSYWGSYN
jgi:hypothetical protein